MKSLFSIFLFITTITFAQSKNAILGFTDFEYGAAIESSVLISNKKLRTLANEETVSDYYPISLYLHGTVYFTKNIGVEIKPGWFFGDDKFSAFELALFLKKRFFEKRIIGKIGINFHKNIGYTHGTFYSTDKSVFMIAAVIGYKPVKSLAVTLGYYNPLSEYWYYEWVEEGPVFLKQVIKLGLEVNF